MAASIAVWAADAEPEPAGGRVARRRRGRGRASGPGRARRRAAAAARSPIMRGQLLLRGGQLGLELAPAACRGAAACARAEISASCATASAAVACSLSVAASARVVRATVVGRGGLLLEHGDPVDDVGAVAAGRLEQRGALDQLAGVGRGDAAPRHRSRCCPACSCGGRRRRSRLAGDAEVGGGLRRPPRRRRRRAAGRPRRRPAVAW